MSYFLDYLKGILIGSGAILPGISSGVFCVIFGIYEKLIDSVLNLFKDFKRNFLFLLPFALGGITGVFLVGKLLNIMFNTYPMATKFCFIGLICGSLPILCKKANKGNGFRLHYLIPLFAAFGVGILSIQLENILAGNAVLNASSTSFFYLVLSGFLMSVGIVVPGVSSTVLLMCLGIYPTYLGAVANLNFSILFPMGIGVLLGSLIFLKLIKFSFDRYYSMTFYAIIGFVLGSIFVLYPGISFSLEGIIAIFLFIIGFFIGLKLEKLEK